VHTSEHGYGECVHAPLHPVKKTQLDDPNDQGGAVQDLMYLAYRYHFKTAVIVTHE